MSHRPAFLAWAVVVAWAGTAGADDGPAQPDAKELAELTVRARAVFEKHCAACHTGIDKPGHSSLPLLSHKAVIGSAAPIPFVNRKKPDDSLILQLMRDGSMPPGGHARPKADDIDAVTRWVKAGAPGYPRSFDDAGTLESLLDDRDAQPEAARPYVRYLSFAHLVKDVRPANLDTQVASLRKRIAERSGTNPTLEPVDGTATLFRLDLRTTGWNAENLFEQVQLLPASKDEPKPKLSPSPITPFDLILLEYPIAQSDLEPLTERRAFLKATKQARPVAFLRADWLSDAIAPGTPLAADLDSLKQLKAELDGGEPATCGSKWQPFPDAGKTTDLKQFVAPPGAWYAWDGGVNPGTFSFDVEVRARGGKAPARHDEQFNLFARADKTVYLELLVVTETDVRRLTIRDDAKSPPGRMTVAKDETPTKRMLGPVKTLSYDVADFLPDERARSFALVLFVSDKEFPAPTVIRSKHSSCHVWRIVPDETNGIDPKRVVRQVLPIRIQK